MIKWILDIYSSKRDTNGNRYHVAQLTSTRTGRNVWFRAHSEGNARLAVAAAAGARWTSEAGMHYTEKELSIRKFNDLENRSIRGACGLLNESDLSASILADLNRNPRKRFYVGLVPGTAESHGARVLFKSAETPDRANYGNAYAAVIGPFRTKAGAEFMRDYGENNPHCRNVADAERLSRSNLNGPAAR